MELTQPVNCEFGEWRAWDDSECLTQAQFEKMEAEVKEAEAE